ncbi:abscission/NoCut checkpoint regulator-like isoform X1 [Symsagittifera roscoffensis]|uniref:abscission/NoCut checkpoint regulator-like isoform X1 n=1 Tax=Symsagittifera roscoffensis TaxID=84072 RepID=UPI00307C4D8D
MSSDRCYECNLKFKLFKKGKPCVECAILHCDNCLLPTAGNRCRQCQQKKSNRKALVDPPKVYTERIQMQVNKTAVNLNVKKTGGGSNQAPIELSADDAIEKRLKQLRQSGPGVGGSSASVPSDDEIKARLNRLRNGDEQQTISNPPSACIGEHLFQPDPVQNSDDLINQIQGELKVDKGKSASFEIPHPQAMATTAAETPDDLIKQVREASRKKDEQQSEDEEDDEETATKKLIAKILEEDRLEQHLGCRLPDIPSDSSSRPPQSTLRGPSSDNEDSELPWCVICNGNAQLRCVDEECEGALYCSRCFKEDHSDSDMRHHRTVKYSK